IVANEVLDCLPHHKLVRVDGVPAVVHVAATLARQPLSRADLAAAMASDATRRRVRFAQHTAALARIPALAAFMRDHYGEWLRAKTPGPPLFVAPRIATLLASAARCYTHADALWIDYGGLRPFHLRAAETRKAFAGPPRSGHGIFDDPGRDDITFMVDFSLAATAARAAGWRVAAYGPQGELAGRSGVRLDAFAVERILQQRALGWMLALAGVGPERGWRRGAVTWSTAADPQKVSVRRYVQNSVREFQRRRHATFQILITRR
ncbi:MAG: SAM-dependent methyltransferase, partial [bacterium]